MDQNFRPADVSGFFQRSSIYSKMAVDPTPDLEELGRAVRGHCIHVGAHPGKGVFPGRDSNLDGAQETGTTKHSSRWIRSDSGNTCGLIRKGVGTYS